jgi:hypothetical protein
MALSRLLFLVPLVTVAFATEAPAAQPDSAAPPGALPTWLPAEDWVKERWVPFYEPRLYRLLQTNRVDVHYYLAQTGRTLQELARERDVRVRGLARELVGSRGRGSASWQLRLAHTRRMLDQSHLADHMLSHATHFASIVEGAERIFGVSPTEFSLRRTTPLALARRSGISRNQVRRRILATVLGTGKQGVALGVMPRAQVPLRQSNITAHVDGFIAPAKVSAASAPTLLCVMEP